MSEQFDTVRRLLDRVRARWRRAVLLDVSSKAAFALAAVVAVTFALSFPAARTPGTLAALGLLAVVAGLAIVGWMLWPARQVPSDRQVARFIEEREPALDERLVSAVDVATAVDAEQRPALASAMMRDAARAADRVDPAAIVTPDLLKRRWMQAAGAAGALAVSLVVSSGAIRETRDAAALVLFPERITLEVTPGNARVQVGSPLTIGARLVGNRAPVIAQLLFAPAGSESWEPTPMETTGGGQFTLSLPSLTSSFRYKVLAAGASSNEFEVAVLQAPRVKQIDVEYAYPPALHLGPRVEEDGGDIYGPAGTHVKVTVHSDRPAVSGQMVLGADKSLALAAESQTAFTAALDITENGSYRVALADADGMKSQGDTEFFIRILDDRPPEVHVVRPASDKRVTRLEEVQISAEAQDDFGVSALELVYAVRGGAEKVVPIKVPLQSTSVAGSHVLFLEDLDVSPGDFISYYVRARDVPRGKRASESRSDIFFLEVRPFEEEFTLAQTQAAMGGGTGNPQLDDLVSTQKEIVVATWKLDRRSRDAQGATSAQDVRAVAKSESELKVRVEQTASSFRTNTLRDPRRTRPQGQGPRPAPPQPAPAPNAPRVGQVTAEEDAMTRASAAMGKAVQALNALRTADALPPEMEALNALLKAQADVKKRQVQQQRAGNGGSQNRSTEDLSSLFDKELAKNQQTNYETKTSTEQTEDKNAPAVDRIKELARRQDELVRKQQEFARSQSRLTAEEQKRQLDSLSREQNELRDRAEQVAQQLQQQAGQQQSGQGEQGQQGQRSQSGPPSGQPGQTAGQQGQAGQSGQRRPGESQNARQGTQGREGGDQSRQMRSITEEMRSAANDLGRQDMGQASARGAKALEQLRELEGQLQASTPEGQRRALGDLQLEARQLADAQRQIAAEADRAKNGQNQDSLRRLAGEQERLSERLQRVEQGLRRSATGQSAQSQPGSQQGQPGSQQGTPGNTQNLQQAAADAARDIQNQRLAERMQQSADAMRQASESAAGQSQGQSGQPNSAVPTAPPGAPPTAPPGAPGQAGAPGKAGAQQELARALDRLADRLNLVEQARDDQSRKMTEQVARARDLRDRMDDLTRQLQELDQQASSQARGSSQADAASGGREPQQGRQGTGQGGSSGDPANLERLREDIARQMREVRELLNDTQRQNARSEGGPGSTFEGQGMVLSAPGTQGFKQDFAKWQELTRQVTLALDEVESSLAQKLRERSSQDRLASGGDERAPAQYQEHVDSYFKALATRKRP